MLLCVEPGCARTAGIELAGHGVMKSISKRWVLAMFCLAGMGACAGGDDGSPIGSSGNCFSPEQTPELAIDHPEAGCSCDAKEKDQCVSTSYQGQAWDIALVCTGRWTSVEDGPCWPVPSP